jgi:hypothetical protein
VRAGASSELRPHHRPNLPTLNIRSLTQLKSVVRHEISSSGAALAQGRSYRLGDTDPAVVEAGFCPKESDQGGKEGVHWRSTTTGELADGSI